MVFGAGDLTELHSVSVRIVSKALKTLLKVVFDVSQSEEYLYSGDNEQGEF